MFLVGRSCRVRLLTDTIVRIADRASHPPSRSSTIGSSITDLVGVDKDGPSHLNCACLSDGRTRQERPTLSKSVSYAHVWPKIYRFDTQFDF